MQGGHIGVGAHRQGQGRHREEGRIDGTGFAADLFLLPLVVGECQTDDQVAAFAFQFFGGNRAAVQGVTDLHRDRRGLVGGALVVDILGVGGPGQLLPVLFRHHRIGQVGNAGQAAAVGSGGKSAVAVQPVADDLFPDGAVRVQDHKHIFVLGHFAALGPGGKGGQGAAYRQRAAEGGGQGFFPESFHGVVVSFPRRVQRQVVF